MANERSFWNSFSFFASSTPLFRREQNKTSERKRLNEILYRQLIKLNRIYWLNRKYKAFLYDKNVTGTKTWKKCALWTRAYFKPLKIYNVSDNKWPGVECNMCARAHVLESWCVMKTSTPKKKAKLDTDKSHFDWINLSYIFLKEILITLVCIEIPWNPKHQDLKSLCGQHAFKRQRKRQLFSFQMWMFDKCACRLKREKKKLICTNYEPTTNTDAVCQLNVGERLMFDWY